MTYLLLGGIVGYCYAQGARKPYDAFLYFTLGTVAAVTFAMV